MNKFFTQSLAYKLIRLALPICAMNLLFIIANFVAVLMLAMLGKDYVAASALAFNTFIAMTGSTNTLFYSVGILTSHAKGSEHYLEAGDVFKNALILAVLLGIPFSLLLWYASDILLAFGQNKHLVELTVGYFHYAAIGMIPTLIASSMNQFYLGIGQPRVFLIVNIIKLPVIIFLLYLTVLGHWGQSKMAVAGMTFANSSVQIITCLIMFVYMYYDRSLKQYELFNRQSVASFKVLCKIIRIGLPIGLQFGGELVAIMVATYFMGYLGVDALAASQIVSQYILFGVMVTLGISLALSVLVSEAYAKYDWTLIRAYNTAALRLLFTFFIIVALIFLLFDDWLMIPYVDAKSHPQLIHLVSIFFKLAAVYLIIDGLRNPLSGALRGLQYSQYPMWVGLLCLWGVSLPLSYLLGLTVWQSPVLLRVGFISGFMLSVVFLWSKFNKILKKEISSACG